MSGLKFHSPLLTFKTAGFQSIFINKRKQMNTEKKPIRIVFADDQPVIRTGFKTLLDSVKHLKLLDIAENGQELVLMADKLKPDVIVTDIQMPEMDGIAATKAIFQSNSCSRILAFTMFEEIKLLQDILDAGALGYLLKNAGLDTIVDAVETVYKHKEYLDKGLTPILYNITKNSSARALLNKLNFSDQEKLVIYGMYLDLSSKEIADKFDIPLRSVETIRVKTKDKLSLKGISGITQFVLDVGPDYFNINGA